MSTEEPKVGELHTEPIEINKENENYNTGEEACKRYLKFMFSDMNPATVEAEYVVIKRILSERKKLYGPELSRAASLLTVEALDFIKSSIDMDLEGEM